jgi:hypothetical protein
MYFVPEGQSDRSQARSAWEDAPRKNRPVGYGMIGPAYLGFFLVESAFRTDVRCDGSLS